MAEDVRVITTFGRASAMAAVLVMLGLGWLSAGILESPEPTPRFSQGAALVIGWLGLLSAGGGLILAVAQLIKPSRLLLTKEGFRLLWLWSMPLIRWSDVEAFGLIRIGSAHHVCFRLTPKVAGGFGRPWWMTVAPRNFHGCVFSGVTGRPARVMAELEDWKDRCGGRIDA